nr:hypothetical protein [Microvirga sp. Mcv34]
MLQSPLKKFQLESLLADQPLEGGNPRLVLLEQCGRGRVLIEGTGLVLPDPDPDQLARQVVAPGQAVQGLAGEVVLPPPGV